MANSCMHFSILIQHNLVGGARAFRRCMFIGGGPRKLFRKTSVAQDTVDVRGILVKTTRESTVE